MLKYALGVDGDASIYPHPLETLDTTRHMEKWYVVEEYGLNPDFRWYIETEQVERINYSKVPSKYGYHQSSTSLSLPSELPFSLYTHALKSLLSTTFKMKYSIVFSAIFAGLTVASPAQLAPQCKTGADCKPNEHCDNIGNCVVNKVTRDTPLAQLGQACHIGRDCADSLECIKDICAAPNNKRDAPLAHLSENCKETSQCVKGLVCDKDLCVAPKDKRDVSLHHLKIISKRISY